jgi:class 3 adenylate cyclase/tetratricopeptide (TPR) repeat protein
MKCPGCRFENRAEAKFCCECGRQLPPLCPACGSKNPPGAKFCDRCGHPLIGNKVDSKQTKQIESERKNVTVLFSDMSGYTAITERLDPEEVKNLMSEIFGEIARVIVKYGGFIERFIGDAVMAIFGVPRVHEDDAVRAIWAAREIHALVEARSPRLEETLGQPLCMHSGINTGLVVTGEVDLEKGAHGITGDAVNLASRLEGLSASGEILVGEETFRKAGGYFIFERVENRRVKGKREAVSIYKVIAPSNRRTRFDVTSEQGLTPLVGREKELDLLLDGYERAKLGQGQAFSVVSEAGMGKSRLLYEFRKAISNEDITFLEGKCLSYGQGVAYHPVIDILKASFDIRAEDTDASIKKKVQRKLKRLGIDETATLPYLLALLSVKNSGINGLPMSPEAKKNRIVEAVNRAIIMASEERPMLIAIEDLHWIDKSSEEYLENLLSIISGVRLLLILTYRPEYAPTWGSRSYHSQLTLGKLLDPDSLVMMHHVLDTENVSEDLENLMLEKPEGVPFFIEEFIKSLKDLKAIEKKDNTYYLVEDIKKLTIPSTIQDVIMARIDSLPEGTREILQTGSVMIERQFSHALIKKVTGLPDQYLRSHLSTLKDSELIYDRGIYPHSTYIFKHALTQNVAYNSILMQRRKQLHEKIGDAIEQIYESALDELYAILAEHYILAENYFKGAEYTRLAAKKALKSASLPEAISYVEKRIGSLEKLPKTKNVLKKIIEARTVLGIHHLSMNRMVEAKEAVSPIENDALQTGYKKRLSLIYTITGIYEFTVKENMNHAYRHLKESLRISEGSGELASSAVINFWMAIYLSFLCDFKTAATHLNKAITINTDENNLWNVSAMKSSLSFFVYHMQGKNNLADQTSNDAIKIADGNGDIYSKALAHTAHGYSCYGKGYLNKALEQLIEGNSFYRRIKVIAWDSWTQTLLADIFTELGEYQKAREHYGNAIRLLEKYTFLPSMININKLGVVRAEVKSGVKNVDLDALTICASDNKYKNYDGWGRRYFGEILLAFDDQHLPEAGHWIESAIKSDRQNGMMGYLGRDYALYARWFKKRGDHPKAKENLCKAIDLLKKCNAVGWVEKYMQELA